MNREQLIAHTQKYMLALSQGVDPISGLPIQEGDAAAQPRLKKCFAYVAELLGELLDGRGYLPLTDEDAARCTLRVRKLPFALSKEQICRVPVSDEALSLNAFLKNVNRAVDARQMERLPLRAINAYLAAQGYVVETREPETVQRLCRRPSESSAAIGLAETEVTNPKTGEIKRQLTLSMRGQDYLLAHLDEIAQYARE